MAQFNSSFLDFNDANGLLTGHLTAGFDFSAASGVFKTPTGAHTINGNVSFAAGVTLTAVAGAGAFDFSLATGIFKTPTGAVTIGPGAVTVSGALTANSGVTLGAGSNLTSDSGTASATAGAATLNKQSGTITSEALTTAAAGDYTLTLTNSVVTAASRVFVSLDNGTNTTAPVYVHRVTPAAGSVVILCRNGHASAALNGTIKINFFVML